MRKLCQQVTLGFDTQGEDSTDENWSLVDRLDSIKSVARTLCFFESFLGLDSSSEIEASDGLSLSYSSTLYSKV